MIFVFKISFVEISWKDILDVLLVTILLVQVYKLMKGSVALRVFLGFLFIYLIYLVVQALEMELLSTILGQFMGVGIVAAIILFQQEIRKFLLLVGRANIFEENSILNNFKFWTQKEKSHQLSIGTLLESIQALSKEKIGALIVLSANSPLKFYSESGDLIDAVLSKRILLSIFNKYSPLHDGAVIIHKNRIISARCILPVTERNDIPAQYGLRHRAGIGMSENTECAIIVVSEETGKIALMKNGVIYNNISNRELQKRINEYLNTNKENNISN